MAPQAACNYFYDHLQGNNLIRERLANLFERILNANQRLLEIHNITAAQIEAIAQETQQNIDIQYNVNGFYELDEQEEIIDVLKQALISCVRPVIHNRQVQLSRNADGLEIKYELANDLRHYPNDHSGESTRNFDRLARIFSFNGTVCTSVSVINNEFCIAINKWPEGVNDAFMFLNQINTRRQQILNIAGQQINALLPPYADLNTQLARANLIDTLITRCAYYANAHRHEFRRFYSDNDWHQGRVIHDLVKTLYNFFVPTSHESPNYACIRIFLNGQTPPVILNTYNNLHAEIEIRNYKRYILDHNLRPQLYTSEATGVSRLCCFGCENSLQAQAFLPMYNHVTGYHSGRYPVMNGDAVYDIQEVQQIYAHLNGQQVYSAYHLMPRAGNIRPQIPGHIIINSQPEFSHSPPSPMLENRPLPSLN